MPPIPSFSKSLPHLLAGATLLAITACGGDSSDNQRPKQSRPDIKLRTLAKVCDGLFDKRVVAEFRKRHGITQVAINRDDIPFFKSGSHFLDMDLSGQSKPCNIKDESGKKKLMSLRFEWGPSAFPADARAARKTVFWPEPESRSTVQMLVDCHRPDLVKKSKAKKELALTGTLNDQLGLTSSTQQRILAAGMQKILDGTLRCHNKITLSVDGER